MKWLCMFLAFPFLVSAQEMRFLDCGQVNFFGEACPSQSPPRLLPPPAPEPLFPRESMAPDTPSLMMNLLEQPTPENAQKFLAWQAQRTTRIQEVQQLLHTLTLQRKAP